MNWNNELQACRTTDEVLGIVEDFVAEQSEDFWSRVPAGAHPRDIAGVNDIHRWHHDLVQELKRTKPASVQLQELCVLMLRASVRIHQIELRELSTGEPPNDVLGCAPARSLSARP
jgi:hypothetical protein